VIQDFAVRGSSKSIEADICLVGAGAAGIALARELSRSGLSIALVESGGINPGEADQQLNQGELCDGVRYKGLVDGRARSLGGATKLWYGQCIRYEPIDFAVRPWVKHSGWPIGPKDLEPYYKRAEEFFDITGQSYHDDIYDRFGLPRPVLDESQCKMHFTIYSTHIDLGVIHQKELEESKAVTMLLHANVTEITTNEAGSQTTGVRIRSLDGNEATIQARAVVLCAGGIENARLLLLSNQVKPAGLGNDRDLVGRFLQDHPNGQTATLKTTKPEVVGELFSLLYESQLRFFPKMELSPALQASEKVSNCNGHFVFEYPEASGIAAGKNLYRSLRRGERPPDFLKSLGHILGDLPETLRAAKRFFVQGKSPLGSPSRIRFQCYLEQEPDPESRVELAETRDALGLRQARVCWKINEMELRTLNVMTAAVGAQVAKLELGELVPDAWLTAPGSDWKNNLGDAYHPIGTTRMSSSAATGVVNPNCEVFGVSGLYVAGSSVFPTSGYGNPTLLIVALAFRLADHLASSVRRD